VAKTLGRRISETSTRAKHLGFAKWRKNRKGTHGGRPIDGFESGRAIYTHRSVVERSIGRALRSDEIVHHIDFDKGNNTIENLFVFQSRGKHRSAHMSFERIVPELVKRNIIFFNTTNGTYELCEKNRWKLI
jgi:ribosomal protein S4E